MATKELKATGVAGNVVTDFTTPEGTMRRILYGSNLLTTDATAADRWVRLGIVNPEGETMICLCAGKEITANQVDQRCSYLQGVYREATFINDVLQVPIAADLVVPAGYTLHAYVENGVVGDDYDCFFMAYDTHEGGEV